jgi:hypothetical protein
MDLQKIKNMLPNGSYFIISERVGIAEGTVAQFFIGIARVSDITKAKILECALAIIEERSIEGLSLVKKMRAKEPA